MALSLKWGFLRATWHGLKTNETDETYRIFFPAFKSKKKYVRQKVQEEIHNNGHLIKSSNELLRYSRIETMHFKNLGLIRNLNYLL